MKSGFKDICIRFKRNMDFFKVTVGMNFSPRFTFNGPKLAAAFSSLVCHSFGFWFTRLLLVMAQRKANDVVLEETKEALFLGFETAGPSCGSKENRHNGSQADHFMIAHK